MPMKRKSVCHSAFFNVRVLIFVALFTSSAAAVLFAVSAGERTRRVETNPSGLDFSPMTARNGGITGSPAAPAGAAQWIWQKPLPQGNPLAAVSFTDSNN